MSPKPKSQSKYDLRDTELGERVTLQGHIVLAMPLTAGAMPGRTHTATCTLCRDRRMAQGEGGGPTVGALGFFVNEGHMIKIVNNHIKAHQEQGSLVHVVYLPRRIRLMNLEDELNGNR